MSSSVIFIGSPEKHNKDTSYFDNVKNLFLVNPLELLFRIYASFIPPLNQIYKRVYIDLLGPLLAVILLTLFLKYGNSLKVNKISFTPVEAVIVYSVLMPIICYLLSRLGKSSINMWETTSLIGYALYGHILTLFVSLLLFQEQSNFFFFVCLIVFGGLSTLRVVLVFLGTIPVPALRLLICSVISVINILYLIFFHFAYMHTTYTYKHSNYYEIN